MSEHKEKHQSLGNEAAVAVITPSGIYPDENLLARVERDTPIASVLKRVAEQLQLTNTSDWVLRVGERQLSPAETFKHSGLECIVDLEWHKPEGGGGA